MILSSHVAVGVAAASAIENPALSWPISFVLHFITDLVPHWDPLTGASKERPFKSWRWVGIILDIVIGLSIGLFFTFRALWLQNNPLQALNILGACFFSVLPDLLEFPYVLLEKEVKLSLAVLKVQQKLHIKAKLPWGLFPQLIILAIALFIALR